MNPAQLLQHFDRISEAPDAVARLRRFVLDLAVRGKLVEQDPDDEPASELLKRIQAEKARLIKLGEIKKEKQFPPVADAAVFDIPPTWQWARLGEITSYIQRGKSPKYAAQDGSPVVSQKCVQWRGLDLTAAKQVTLESLAEYEDSRFLRDGDLLWNSTGTGTIGRVIRLVSPPERLVCDSHVTVVRCLEGNPEFVRVWLRSDHVYTQIEDRAAGSTNQVELTAQMAIHQVVPLPPLAEQHRIVAKVDELMALCDQLEAAKSEREARRARLVAASLHRIGNAAQPSTSLWRTGQTDGEIFVQPEPAEALAAAARFHLNHISRLTTRPEHIKQLRQTILNLAVRGRLVPQDPNDEPAAELLKRIQSDIKKYGTQNRVKTASIELVTDEVHSFSIPEGWTWTRLAGLCRVVTDGDHLPPPKSEQGVAFLTIGNVSKGELDFRNCRYVSQDYFDKIAVYRRPEAGDLLYTVVGATYGRPVLVETDRAFCVQRHIAILKPAEGVLLKYLHLLLGTPFTYEQATRSLTGTAQPTIPLLPLRNFLAPLPPLPEQHRIVAKVDELMALCDQLEAQLTTTQTDSRRLLEAVLRDALAPASDMEEAAA